MTYSFVVPPELQAMWEAGKLIRRGALLINANGGGIVAHLQETGAFSVIQPLGSVLSSLTGVTSAGSLVTGAISVVQNEQIKRRIDVMQSMLGAMQGLQVATLAGSIASLGVSAAALLHKSAADRTSPFPGQIYPATSVMGVPSAVKPLSTATRTWNSAT